MRIVRTSEGRVSLLDLEPRHLGLLCSAMDELNRADNPVRPFSGEFQRFVDGLAWELGQGFRLFSRNEVARGIPPIFRVVPVKRKGEA